MSMRDVAEAFRNAEKLESGNTVDRNTAALCIEHCEAAAREDASAQLIGNRKRLERGVAVLKKWLYPAAADYLTQWLAEHPPMFGDPSTRMPR
jgi:hypothetical protein